MAALGRFADDSHRYFLILKFRLCIHFSFSALAFTQFLEQIDFQSCSAFLRPLALHVCGHVMWDFLVVAQLR